MTTTLTLPTPRSLAQDPIYTVQATVRKQFERVVLMEGKKEVAVLIAKNPKSEKSVGSANMEYLCGLLLGATGGRGDQPGGVAIWAFQHADQMKHLDKYTIIARPTSRGVTLEGTVSQFKAIVQARANVLEPSREKYPIAKTVREKEVEEVEPEQVDVVL